MVTTLNLSMIIDSCVLIDCRKESNTEDMFQAMSIMHMVANKDAYRPGACNQHPKPISCSLMFF